MIKRTYLIVAIGLFMFKGALLPFVYAQTADPSFLAKLPEKIISVDTENVVQSSFTERLPRLASNHTITKTKNSIPNSQRASTVISQYTDILKRQMALKGLKFGSPILMRIFKVPSILEVWVKKGDKFVLFKTYEICRFSGRLGPKLKNGDKQAPEGFYNVPASALNPNSNYFLSFNLGYPNEYDRYHSRTGSLLMVHGECASVGCYAMSNTRMSEIYTLMHAAFENGQKSVQVQAYPFLLTTNNMNKMQRHPYYQFWLNLKQGYDLFEKTQSPLKVNVSNGKYYFNTVN